MYVCCTYVFAAGPQLRDWRRRKEGGGDGTKRRVLCASRDGVTELHYTLHLLYIVAFVAVEDDTVVVDAFAANSIQLRARSLAPGGGKLAAWA